MSYTYDPSQDDNASNATEVPSFTLYPKQAQVLDYLTNPIWSGINQVVYGGSIRSAKSVCAAVLALTLCHTYAGIRGIVVRKSQRALDQFFVPKMHEVFALMYGADATPTWDRTSYGELRFHNGSSLIMMGMDVDRDESFLKLHGAEAAFGICEEAQELPDELLLAKLGSRLSHAAPFGLYPKVLITTNPTPKDHWIHRLFYAPNKAGTLPDFRRFVQAFPWDNLSLSESWHTMMKQTLPENELQVNYYGDWDHVSSTSDIFDPDALRAVFRPTPSFGGTSYITVDPATDHGKDSSVITVWSDWHCHTIISDGTLSSGQIISKVQDLQRTFSCSPQRTICDANGSGYGIAQALNCVPFMASAAPHKGEPYQHMKAQLYWKLATRVNEGTCSIGTTDPKLQTMIVEECGAHKAVDQYKEAKNKVSTKDDVKQRIKRSPDLSDALSYRAYFDYVATDFSIEFF